MPICVAGMHRSGTSLVARLLMECGVYLGPQSELIPPDDHNQGGYWENARFVQLNNEVLSALQAGWDSPPDLPVAWDAQSSLSSLRAKAVTLVEDFAGREPWGWKDPRNSVTLPFWKLVVPSLAVVICVRNPLEVAHSLAQRGYSSTAFALQLWLSYNQQILSSSQSNDRVITHYDAYFHDARRELQRVLGCLKLCVADDMVDAACSVVSPSLRHSCVTTEMLKPANLPDEVMRLYARLCAESGAVLQHVLRSEIGPPCPVCSSGSAQTQSYLDSLRSRQSEMTLAETEQEPHVLTEPSVQQEQEVLALTQRLAEREWALQASSERLAERERGLRALSEQVAEQARAVQALTTQVGEKERSVQALTAQVEEKEQAAQVLMAQLEDKEQALQVLSAEVEDRERAEQALTAQVDEKELSVQALTAQVAAITSGTGWGLLQVLWRMRLFVAPHGSFRERVMRLGMRGLRVWRRQGLVPLARRAIREAAALARRVQDRAVDLGRSALPKPVRRVLRRAIVGRKPPLQDLSAALEAQFGRAPEDRPGPLYDLIIFPIIDWGFRFQRPQQIAVRLAQDGHRVFYVRTTFQGGESPTIRSIRERVFEVQLPGPSQTNIYRDAMDERLTETAHNAFETLRRACNIVVAVCFVDLPFWRPLALSLRDANGWKVIYDCMDRHSGFATNDEQMLRQEDDLCRRSDLVLTTAHSLLAEKSQQNPNCLLIPNATDFDHFRLRPPASPAELTALAPPIIGYYGAISDWFDSDLVRELALARPEWQFVLIGHTYGANLAPMRGLANVRLLEEKPYADLPAYLHAFDVCIIPFKSTPLTQATNPVKLYEFLSAGKSVVATNLGELQHYADYVRLADGPGQWLTAIEGALTDYAPERVTERIVFASQNTWSQRVALIQEAVLALYPKASIIIVTYNNLDYTRLCLQSIHDKTVYPSVEVIVVDNGSRDDTVKYLEALAAEHPNAQVLLNDTNEGFARANNRGVAAATGEYIVFLNNDTVVSRGWLSRLIGQLGDPRVGMVGPVTNWSGNESRIEVDYHTLEEMEAFAKAYTQAHDGQIFEIRMLAFFCAAMRRAVVEEVGPLDERFGLGTFEDDDYAMRVKQKGYRVICAEDAFVHHWGRASFSRLGAQEHQRLFDENRSKFEAKWGTKWEPHRYRTGI